MKLYFYAAIGFLTVAVASFVVKRKLHQKLSD
jgi:hypothetical protein